MSTTEDLYSKIAVQDMSNRVMTTEQELDPFVALLERSARGVEKLDLAGGGNAFRFQRIVGIGKAGVARHVKPLGPSVTSVTSGSTSVSSYFNEVRTYPSALESSIPGFDRMTGYLAEMRGNIAIEETILMADKLSSVLVSYLDRILDSTALALDLLKVAHIHTPSSTTRHVSTLSSVTAAGTPSGSEVSFVPLEGNEMLCTEGQSYQIYGTTGTYVGCRHTATGEDDPSVEAICIGVDPTTRRVYLKSRTGSNIFSITGNLVAAGDILVHRGELRGGAGIGSSQTGTPEAYGPYGFVDFLVNTGNLFNLSVDVWHRHKSIIDTSLGGPWNEDEADKFLMWYGRWHKKYPISNLFMTGGALLAYQRTMKGMFIADRTGVPAKIKGGHVIMPHTHLGQSVGYSATGYMRAGWIIGLYMENGNFEMLVPPSPGDESGDARIGSDIQFKRYGSTGKGLFRPVGVAPPGGGAVLFSDLREAPFVHRYNIMPTWHLAGLMIGGVDEINLSL